MRDLRPTAEGLAALALGGFIFLLATNLMAGWLFFLVAFLVAVLVVGLVTAVSGVRRVQVRVGGVPPAVEGGVVTVPVAVQGRRLARFIRLAVALDGKRGEAFLPVVDPGLRRQLTLRITAPRRGVYPLAHLHVISSGLVGMFRVERRLPVSAEVVVRPRYQSLPAVPLATEGSDGAAAPQRRRGDDLFGVREYLPGDPARHIHWRSSARHRRLLVKEFEDPVAPVMTLVVDVERGQGESEFDQSARAAASIAWTALQHGRRVALLWCGAEGPVAVEGNWEHLWDALGRLRADGPPLSQALHRLQRYLPETAVPVVVTGRPGALGRPLVMVGPQGAATDWVYDAEGTVRCVDS
jgi:uncharacterized protein (DUF58 family)